MDNATGLRTQTSAASQGTAAVAAALHRMRHVRSMFA